MAFPQTVLPVRVRIAPGGQPAADPSTWVWVDITQWVRVASNIVIEEGKSDEGSRVDPGKCALTLDNRDGRFSTRNVLGPWYGRLKKGTPLRVGTIAVADDFGRTVANSWGSTDTGQVWAITSPSAWAVNGASGQLTFSAANTAFAALAQAAELLDVDAQFTVSVPAVMTGASVVVAMYLRYIDANNYYWLSCEFDPAGTVTAKIRRTLAGVTTVPASANPIPSMTYTAGQKMRVRAQADGPALRLKIWADGGAEPDAWTLTATDTKISAAGLVGFYFWCLSGNTNTKPFAVSVDSLEVEAVEFTGTVPDWPPRWDKSQRDATAPINAAGILRRLQQTKSPLRSPITRMFLRNNPVALWPMEDDSSATVAAPGMPGVAAAAARAVEFAQTTPALAGAPQTAGITASTVMSGLVPGHTSTGTWGVVWFAQLLAPPAATTRIMSVSSYGSVRLWGVDLDSTTFRLRGFAADGTTLIDFSNAYSPSFTPPIWTAYDLLVKQNGGNVDVKLIQYGVLNQADTPTMSFGSGSFAGSVGSPAGWSMQGSLGYNGGRLGAVAVFNYEPPFVTYAFANAANGYIGETAAERIARLCAEENVQVVVEEGASSTLGPQRTERFVNLLYAAEDADHGILYERAAGLAYRPRGARYNRPVELPLDFAVGDLAEAPEPTDDDQQLKNQWTVSRDSGSTAVAADQTSIDESALAEETRTINVQADGQLQDHASWGLATTTVDEYRWPSVRLNLARNTGQIRLWRAAAPFPRATVANEPSQVAGNAVDVTVLGHAMTLGAKSWDIDLNCASSTPWSEVAVYGTSRKDSATTTLLEARTDTDTHFRFSTRNPRQVWSQTAVPYDVKCAGQPNTVVWMSAPGSLCFLDGGFETGVTGWSTTGVTLAPSTAFAHRGTGSAQVTVIGTPTNANIFNNALWGTVTVGSSYTATAWIYSAAGVANARINLSFYNSGGTFISSPASTPISVPAGVWTKVSVTAVAPASSVWVRAVPGLTSSPTAGTIFYVDDVDVTLDNVLTGAGPFEQHATVTRHPLLPKALSAGEPIRLAQRARKAH